MDRLVFATGNIGKVEEVSRFLGIPVDHASIDLHEIQSLDLEEIVRDKALRAYEKVQRPVLVEDVSFIFNALGKLPGPLIKWFEKELGLEKLCRLVDRKDRACIATVCYGLHDGKKIHLIESSMAGTVAEHPRGEHFGWSPIFIPEGAEKTYAEMSLEERAPIAMRRKALEKLYELIRELKF